MRRSLMIFIGIFLFVMYAVPITQAIVEVGRGNRIQIFDLVQDTFVTPIKREKTTRRLLTNIRQRLDSAAQEAAKTTGAVASEWDSKKAQDHIDEALVDAAEFKKTVQTVNRHVTINPASSSLLPIEPYLASLDSLLGFMRNGGAAAAAEKRCLAIRTETEKFLLKYPEPRPLTAGALIIKNLPHIFWDAKYLRPYEKEMENTSVFTAGMRPIMFFVRYALYQDLGEKGVLGKDGWFFYKQDVDYLVRPYIRDKRSVIVDPNDKVVTDNPIQAITTFKKQLESFGVDLLVVIVPGKPSIYPEMIVPGLKAQRIGLGGNSRHMINDLRAAGVECVDLFSVFVNDRNRDSAGCEPMYLQKDTHWKARGVRLAAASVAQRVKQYPWYEAGTTEYAIDSVTIDRVGDIGVMTTLTSFKAHELAMMFAPEKTLCYQVFQVQRDERGAETGRTLYKDEFRSSKILVLGDSFSRIYQGDEPRGAGWIAHFAHDLSQPVASIVSDGGASTLVRESLARKPNLLKNKKLVVWEVVERDFRYGNEGWKDVPIQVAEK